MPILLTEKDSAVKITVSSTPELIASVPALLGLNPHESMVLVSIVASPHNKPVVGPLLRLDLPDLEHKPEKVAVMCATILADQPILAVTGVVVCSNHQAPNMQPLPLTDQIDTFTRVLRQHGLDSLNIVHVPEIVTDAPWRSYHCQEAGALPDPASTRVAATLALAGYTVARDLNELKAQYTPAPPQEQARVLPLITAAREAEDHDRARPASARARLARADAAVHAAGRGQLPSDDATAADLVATFTTVDFRDAMFVAPSRLINIGTRNLAMYLWRLSPEPYADELATVIAAHAYCCGDGVAARIALEAVRSPTVLSRLISGCVYRGLTPERFRQFMNQSSRTSRDKLTSGSEKDQS